VTSVEDGAGEAGGPYRRGALLRRALPLLRWGRAHVRPLPRLDRFEPRSMLSLPEHHLDRACVPAIDAHAHLGRWLTPDSGWMAPDVGALLGLMDACNIEAIVNLDGRWDTELDENLDRYDRAHPGRFFTFCQLDWAQLDRPGGADALVRSLEHSAGRGARGLKVWKDLGLGVEVAGRRVLSDDSLLAPVWEAAGALDLPVVVHTADPLAFFHPADRFNERVEELRRHPSVSQASVGPSGFRRLLDAFEATVAAHPGTTFVGAHVGGSAEDLSRVDALLRYPNVAIDLSARIAELGRQPRAAAALIERHPDRVLFGTDQLPIDAERYRVHFRMLETLDEHFPYSSEGPPPHGRWAISGLGLPRAVLEQVYAGNARRIFRLPDAAPRASA
jgi:predicted TIM-barrel fold metal-dependent hydrolase